MILQQNIDALEQAIASNYGNVAGIVVLRDGKTLYENYFNGYNADNTLHVYSVTKSIFSALIGIAINQGHIKSVDQKVLDFFPDYTIPQGEKTFQQITIRNMLSMTAPYKYDTEPYEAYFMSEDWAGFALDLLGGEGKIGDFQYSAMVGTHILSGLLTKATGTTVLDFATKNLFSPLDMKVPGNVSLRTQEEHIAAMSDKNTSGWAVDPQGINPAGWGLFLRPVDMAKFGQLYLDHGLWNGKQIVPANWIADSTREHSRWEEAGLSYGYLWWVINGDDHIYAAMGDGGNVIYINEKKRMVIAITSLFIPDAKDRIELIMEHIEPTFYS